MVKVTLSFSTELKERGNKRKAESLLALAKTEYKKPSNSVEFEKEKIRIKALIMDTANIYTHFDYNKKINSAETMLNVLSING